MREDFPVICRFSAGCRLFQHNLPQSGHNLHFRQSPLCSTPRSSECKTQLSSSRPSTTLDAGATSVATGGWCEFATHARSVSTCHDSGPPTGAEHGLSLFAAAVRQAPGAYHLKPADALPGIIFGPGTMDILPMFLGTGPRGVCYSVRVIAGGDHEPFRTSSLGQ
jgi:hypothetical protein